MIPIKKLISSLLLFIFASSIYAADTQTTLLLTFNTGNAAPNGLPSTTITIQGKTLPLIFDTGDSTTGVSLTEQALSQIKVNYVNSTRCFNRTDGRHCQREFIIPEINIGGFVVKNVPGSVMPPLTGQGFVQTDASRNGILGYKVLSQFNVLLDYPNSKVILVKREHLPRDYDVAGWTSVPFYGRLMTKLSIDGHSMVARWDTGALPSVIKSTSAKAFSQQSCPPGFPYKLTLCRLVTYGLLQTPQGKFLAGNNWFQVQDIIPATPFDVIIGSNFYAKNLTYFDFDQQRIAVKPVPTGR